MTDSPIYLQSASLVFWVDAGSQAGGGRAEEGWREGRRWEEREKIEENNRAHQCIETRLQSNTHTLN